MLKRDVGITTVVDEHPRFWCELVLWVLCVNRYLNNPKRVYVIGTAPSALEKFVRNAGIDLRHGEPLISASPHCNKLIPFLDDEGFEDQIVTDCDVFATGDFSIFFDDEKVRLPPNNHAVPPLHVFRRVFSELGLNSEPEPGLSIFPGQGANMETYARNVSAGVICIPLGLRWFAQCWYDEARRLSENLEILGPARGHCDQISFAVAAERTRLPFSHLPAQCNAILQLLPSIRSLYAMHLTSGHIPQFPNMFSDRGHVLTDGVPAELHEKIDRFNTDVEQASAVMGDIPELAEFRSNFLNPNYRR